MAKGRDEGRCGGGGGGGGKLGGILKATSARKRPFPVEIRR